MLDDCIGQFATIKGFALAVGNLAQRFCGVGKTEQFADVRRATVNRIENARVTAIDLGVLEKIADVLRVEPGFIIVRAPDTDDSTEHPTKGKRSRR